MRTISCRASQILRKVRGICGGFFFEVLNILKTEGWQKTVRVTKLWSILNVVLDKWMQLKHIQTTIPKGIVVLVRFLKNWTHGILKLMSSGNRTQVQRWLVTVFFLSCQHMCGTVYHLRLGPKDPLSVWEALTHGGHLIYIYWSELNLIIWPKGALYKYNALIPIF